MAFGDLLGTLTGGAASITNPATASGSVSVSVGDLIFVETVEVNPSPTMNTPSDNLGNTYTKKTQNSTDNRCSPIVWWSRVTNAGTLTTFSVNALPSTNDYVIGVCAYAGPFLSSTLDKSPNDVTDIVSPFNGPATGTLTQANELIVCFATNGASVNWTATAPFTKDLGISSTSFGGGGSCASLISHQVVSATTTQTPQWTGSNPSSGIIGVMSFNKDTSVVVAPPIPISSPFTMPGGTLRPAGPLVVPASSFVLDALRRNPELTRRALANLLKW